MSHTPGPWEIGHQAKVAVYGYEDLGGEYSHHRTCVAHCNHTGDVPAGVDEANARLIAAAPELLAACKLALGAFERNDCINWDSLARAIAKAEGRS